MSATCWVSKKEKCRYVRDFARAAVQTKRAENVTLTFPNVVKVLLRLGEHVTDEAVVANKVGGSFLSTALDAPIHSHLAVAYAARALRVGCRCIALLPRVLVFEVPLSQLSLLRVDHLLTHGLCGREPSLNLVDGELAVHALQRAKRL